MRISPDATESRPKIARATLRATRAHQAREAHDLAALDVEAYVAELAARVVQGLHLQRDVADVVVGLGREDVVEGAADHQLDDGVHVQLAGRLRAHVRTVADDRDLVGDPEQFVEPVRDVDDAGALRTQLLDLCEQDVDFLGGDGGRRLVEDDDVRFLRDRLHDLEHLDVGHRQVLQFVVGPVAQAFALEQVDGAGTNGLPVDAADTVARLLAEEERLLDGHFGDVVQLLADHRDPVGARFDRAGDVDLASAHKDLSTVRLVNAIDDLHHRRLASAVLAADHVHAGPTDHQVHLAQRGYPREALLDPSQFKQRGIGMRSGGDAVHGNVLA